MSSQKDNNNSSTPMNSINTQNKSFFNPEKSKMIQDLLYFKNDILKDIRKLEEKLGLKLNEQNSMISEQYENFEKKLTELSNYISKVHSLVQDTNDIMDQIKNLMKFKNRAEENFNRINSRITTFQKENKDYINNIEKLINENLKYPGVIGRNAKFLNFRYFIDFIIKSLKDVNEFKDEIRDFDINDFKKKINSDISDFRFAINDNYKNSVRLIGNTFKEVDVKIADIIKKNYDNMKENEEKFEELKNRINNYFTEYQTKFESLEKNINDKFNEQFNEIAKFKTMKDEFIADMNNFKSSLEIQKKEIINNNNINENQENSENLINNTNNIMNNNIINDIISDNNNNTNSDKEFKSHLNSRNINCKTILTKEKRNLLIELLNNINVIDEYQNSEAENNVDSLLHKGMHSLHLERSKSYEKTPRNYIDENNEVKIFSAKKKSDNNINILNKDIIRSNYSISNIPNIKIKKVILPEHLIRLNMNQTTRAMPSENKGFKMLQNNIPSTKSKKNSDFNDNNSNGKNIFNVLKINKIKEAKNKIIRLANSDQADEKKHNLHLNRNMSSFLIIKAKSKNSIIKNLENIKKRKKNNLSFDGEKNYKDEQAQMGFRKTFNMKNKIREIILMNSKNLKKSRKIEL